jgi:hypothetical protein
MSLFRSCTAICVHWKTVAPSSGRTAEMSCAIIEVAYAQCSASEIAGVTDKEMRLSLSVRILIKGNVAATHYVIYICLCSLDSFHMLGKQAKILSPADVADLLIFVDCTRNPIRNRVIVLLSAKAGMRAYHRAS